MEEVNRLSFEDKLSQFNQLGQNIERQNSKQALISIRTVIDLYVQHQKTSEDFFMSLCEYNIVPKLLTLPCKGVSALEVLEVFNLLLANSSKSSTLVYLFSQPTLHDFLFQHFSLQKQSPQTVQYYVQLLKTIILKISQPEHRSMVKLFCNSRFAHFPLLTTVAVLGIEQDAEELVRVTANQCLLLLIGLLNQAQVGLEYLCELQIVVYYHSLLDHLFSIGGEQREEELRFVVDLVNCLRANTSSLSIFMNLLTNHLLFRHNFHAQHLLAFLISFYARMEQHSSFPAYLKQQILLVLSTIISKYLRNSSVNYTYFSALRVLPHLHIPQKPHLMRFYKQRCKLLEQYLIRQNVVKEQSAELQFVLEEWLHFNDKNIIVSPMRDVKHKSKNAISQFFTSKEQNMEKYVQSVMTLAGIQSSKIKSPIYKLSYSTDYQTSLYLVQLVCIRFSHKIMQTPQASDNYSIDFSSQITTHEPLLLELYNLATIVQKHNFDSYQQPLEFVKVSSIRSSRSSRDSIKLPKMEGFAVFARNIRSQLIRVFCLALTSKNSRPDLSQLCLMSAIASKLILSNSLQPIYVQHLLGKLKQLQVYITQDVFNNQNFYLVFRYITKGRQKSLLKKIGKAKNGDQSPRKKNHGIKTRIESNFVQYEVVKRLIDGSVKSLTEFIEEYWKCRFFSQTKGVAYPVTQFLYKESSNCILEVVADENFEFALKKTKYNDTTTYNITRDDCTFDRHNPTILSFQDHNYLIDFQTEQRAKNFRQDLNRLRQERKELIMNGILEYLTFSYESLAASSRASIESSVHQSQRKYRSQFG